MAETYRKGKSALAAAGNESPAFDAACLFQKVFGYNRQELAVHDGEPAQEPKIGEYTALIEERAQGRPLQYILGKWPFMELELLVGEGVLIPREETELLVRTAAELLKGKENPEILDLCSGTGAVALGLASLFPNAPICAAELYDGAFSYLQKNIIETGFRNVKPVRLDVLHPGTEEFPPLDCIVSNPPYVTADEMKTLQAEVKHEPRTALEGGADGLVFYRAIADLWLPKLKPGGIAAVEVGDKQAAKVASFFRDAGLGQIRVEKDFNGIDRVVAGVREKD
ncbi:peptide chain release factor N(5)-glutamine methyltransferase [Caproiciproducens galactitolivorans]|uniref:peptide chain release factor N(5)-glutamine methyltransferase n=1 Tax=Caproiciproducens galactitolivorans TaxID=642589 RepID=A0ABT4BSF8_9FIRM|nr:peptide chain release factor N(5)-glutamine methyltransferase [Caproiciproducens galactitolivorans]MCY1713836.1 peptide chain release factor N(5)-glutamine methyltransferase [Caproiciproducens galactitolivorans]